MNEAYLKWLPKSQQPVMNKPNAAACAVCKTEYLKRGSFIFASGMTLRLCAVDAARLNDLTLIEIDEAISELVERVSAHCWRIAA